MTDLLTSETLLRVALFTVLLLAMLGWEWRWPRLTPDQPLSPRRLTNLGIGLLNIVLIRLGFPILGLSLALLASDNGWGLLNLLSIPPLIGFVVALLLMDLVIWGQHRLFHIQPLLWRLHRMHHSDQIFDTTTGVRFHPLEAVLSMAIKSLAIVVLGIGPLAYLVFEVILSATSLFNHGNVRISKDLDRWLRLFIVTPDMHRVHHSVDAKEMNSNFGFNLPWWDRLFGTYKAEPDLGHEHMEIGTGSFTGMAESRLDRLLIQPFRN